VQTPRKTITLAFASRKNSSFKNLPNNNKATRKAIRNSHSFSREKIALAFSLHPAFPVTRTACSLLCPVFSVLCSSCQYAVSLQVEKYLFFFSQKYFLRGRDASRCPFRAHLFQRTERSCPLTPTSCIRNPFLAEKKMTSLFRCVRRSATKNIFFLDLCVRQENGRKGKRGRN
jgi:hypothetical protein